MPPGDLLPNGGTLVSPNGNARLSLQADGNLVLHAGPRLVWQTETRGIDPVLRMQGDGNLVLYHAGRPVWSTGTREVARTGTSLEVQDDGNLVLHSVDMGPIWSRVTGPVWDVMWPGFVLRANQARLSSDRKSRMVMQGDGNLVVYTAAGAVWSTHTRGTGVNRAVMQSDGNFVLYNASNGPVWSSFTYMYHGTSLRMQDDSNVVLTHGSRVVWSWATGGIRQAGWGALTPEMRTALQSNGTWNSSCPVSLNDLAYMEAPYTDRGGVKRWGRLYIHRNAIGPVGQAFEDMDLMRFPVWEFGGFRCEMMPSGRWSQHAYGLAVDVNWTVNPYTNGSTIIPPTSGAYLDRSRNDPGMFYPWSTGVQSFARNGWGWGGSWTYNNGRLKDYMHFSWNNN